MAMAKCRECGTEVSDSAKTCPKCGIAKPVKKTSLIAKIFLGLLGLWVLGLIISGGSGTGGSTSTSVSSSAQPSVAVPVVPGSQWSYSHVADAMSKGTSYHAVVSSKNTVEFKFPYAGAQHARLNLRTDPRYGKDVIFSIERGQILCHSYEDCTVLVRFDDEQATNYSAAGAADNSTETIFIRNYDRFVGKMLKAKRVRISANIYQEGAPVFEFDVSGFDTNKYKPSK
ncbi:MAG: zinc ribbon domain-containing protein [Rugosibacter sp.]|nr:zinc ribbon domain-containing protein [Rugosibacter sp.]